MAKKRSKKNVIKWGREGGSKTLEKHGSSHFVKAAAIRWERERLAKKQQEGRDK